MNGDDQSLRDVDITSCLCVCRRRFIWVTDKVDGTQSAHDLKRILFGDVFYVLRYVPPARPRTSDFWLILSTLGVGYICVQEHGMVEVVA